MLIKGKLVSGAIAATMLVTAAAPADARYYGRYRHYDRGVDAGDVLGAVVLLGGIAAIASAASSANRGRSYDGGYAAERRAVDACISEAERGYSRYDRNRVRNITNVEREGGYYQVQGVLEIEVSEDTRDDGYIEEGSRTEGFSCTARGDQVYDFQRGDGGRW
jgi:hypothetical protein